MAGSTAWILELADTLFELFDGNWDFHPTIQRQLIIAILPVCFPDQDPAIALDEGVAMVTLLCRLAQAVATFEEATETVVAGFASLRAQTAARMLRTRPDGARVPSAFAALVPFEIDLTMFLCGVGELGIEALAEMRDRGMIPSNYHRRLVLCAIQKFAQSGFESVEARELWEVLLREGIASPQVVEDLALLDAYQFDRWDSPLSRITFDGFVEQ
jgi:hypothetical protein